MRNSDDSQGGGVGFGRQVVPVGRLWGGIPTGLAKPGRRPRDGLVRNRIARWSGCYNNGAPSSHCRRFNVKHDESRSSLSRENLDSGIRRLDAR